MKSNEPLKNSSTGETPGKLQNEICELPDEENQELQDFFAEIDSDRSAEELKKYMEKC